MAFIQYNSKKSPFGGVASLLLIVLAFVGMFWLAGKVFSFLAILSPVLLIGAAILDYKVIINYVKYVFGLFSTNIILAIGLVLLTVWAFPVVCVFLLVKAYASYKLKSIRNKNEELTPYEEVEVVDEDFLELPNIEKSKKQESSDYEQLFD